MLLKQHAAAGYVGGMLPVYSPTLVFGAGIDSGESAAFDIGFPFEFNGVTYTQFRASGDGWISLGSASSGWSYNNHASNWPAAAVGVFPWWDDMRQTYAGTAGFPDGGHVRFELQGVAPHRFLVVDWLANAYYSQTVGSCQVLPFQLILRETTFGIECRYGPSTIIGTPADMPWYGATSGARGVVTVSPAPPDELRCFWNTGHALGGGDEVFLTGMLASVDWPGDAGNATGYAFDISFNLPPAPGAYRIEAYLYAGVEGVDGLSISENGVDVFTFNRTDTEPFIAALASWEAMINASGDLAGTYAVRYSEATRRVSISELGAGTFHYRMERSTGLALGYGASEALSGSANVHTGSRLPLAIATPMSLTHDPPLASVEISKRMRRLGRATVQAHFGAKVVEVEALMTSGDADTLMLGALFAQRVRIWQDSASAAEYSADEPTGWLDVFGHTITEIRKIGYNDEHTLIRWIASVSA